MGMMAQMRNLAPWFIITVGGLFVLFMVLSDSNLTQLASQGNNAVGIIDGKEISYQQFSSAVENLRAQQVQATGQEIPEEQMSQFRDRVWESLVSQELIQKKIEEFEITVTDEEIRDLLLGPNPPFDLQRNFIDSTGQFNRAAYESAIMNPQNREIMINVEEGVRQQIYQQKLRSYLNASVIVSDEEIKNHFLDQNLKMNADYIYVNERIAKDSNIVATDSEISSYYSKNKNDYKIDEQRTIQYVMFRTQPSPDDTIAIERNLKAIIEDMEGDTSSFKTFVEIYSDQPYSRDTIAISQLAKSGSAALGNANPGDIVGPILSSEGYTVYNYIDRVKGKDTFVKASHILISTRSADQTAAQVKADSIYNELRKGADFAAMAREHSEDPGSGRNGGDLGWFGEGQMVPEFSKACFEGRIGRIQRPVKTNFGYHIIRVDDKSSDSFVIEKIINKIKPSATTIDNLYNDASDFSYLANNNGFASEAELLKYAPVKSRPFAENTNSISGIGVSKALVKFAFENKVGTISEVVYKVPAGYVVAMVDSVAPAGFKPLEDVKSSIENEIKKEKRLERSFEIAKEIRSKITDETDYSIAAQVFPGVKISNVRELTTKSPVTGVGKDYVFNEYAATGELNKLSDAIKGERGSYLIKVTSRTEFDEAAFEVQKNSIRELLLNQKRQTYFATWINNIKEEADVQDFRYKFYR